jgi:hypothetical protein
MRVPLVILTLLAMPGFAAGDDGAATAQDKGKPAAEKQAKERKGPVKVYTDEDLKKARETSSGNVTVLGSPDAPPPSAAAEQEGSGAGSGAGNELGTTDTPQSDRGLDEAAWRSMAREAYGSVRGTEAHIRELEARIQDLLLGDRDPNPPDLLDPSRLQKREAARADAMKQLDEARARLAADHKAVEDLQERARTAGVPQSWVEEPQPEPEPPR